MLATPKNFVWLQTGFLGDIVLTTAAITLAKSRFPSSRHVLITTPVGHQVLQGLPSLDRIVTFSKRSGGFLSAFRQVKRDLSSVLIPGESTLLLQPHKSVRSSLLAMYLGFPRVTYRQTNCHWGATLVERIAYFHEAHRIGLLLEPLGVSREEIVSSRPFLEAANAPSPTFADLREFTGKLVGIAPGSKWGTKMWPISHFVELARALLGQPDVGIVLLGEKSDKWLSREILHKLGHQPHMWDFVGETSLPELREIFPRLSLLISNDSAPIHFASAFNIPTVAIFGATVSAMGFSPLADGSVSCELPKLPCRPCSDHGPTVCPLGHFKCMIELKPDRVWGEVRRALALT